MPNSLPFLSGFVTSLTFGEEAANLSPQLIDGDVSFLDADNNFDGGTLVMSGLLADDIVSIRDQGTGAGQIGFSGGNVTFAGTIIGTATGGAGTALSVTFNANANSAAIEALIENLTFATLSDTPEAARTLYLGITDAAGAKAVAPITVTARTGAANPFNGFDIGDYSAPTLADLDGDGDLDLVIGETDGILNYYENTGTGLAPVFTVRTGAANPFDGIDVGLRSNLSLADLDGDGDFDLVIGEEVGNLNYYENTGTGLAPVFTVRTGAANPFDGIDDGPNSAPSFADLDGDGDLDLVLGVGQGTLNYYENTGTSLAPVYTARTGAANPFNSIDIGVYSTPSFADLDGDGDLDLVIGENQGTLNYFENTGTGLAPVYTARTGAANPFNGIDIGTYSNPDFADLDGDGDLDLVIGAADGSLDYYENTDTGMTPAFTVRTFTANPFNDIDIGETSNPDFADLDGDGDLDLVIGEQDGNLNYYENTGTGLAPVYTARTGAANPFNGINVVQSSAPSLADLDGDGDLDLVIGDTFGTLSYYENTGTGLAPVYTVRTGAANPFDGFDVGLRSNPSFADLDGDGDLDLIIGEFDYILNYYENTGTGLAPVYTARTGAANPFNGIDNRTYSAPSLVDLDGDGDLDLVNGGRNGSLDYYENTGTSVTPVYTERTGAANPFNGIDVGLNSTLDLADLDGDGDLDLVIGENVGNLNYYENTGAGFGFVLNVTAFDDPASPRDDAFASLETAPAFGDVFADNGNGVDIDPDSALAVTAVNGSAGSVGAQITLASGALLTLNADGTFNYDPNGQFEHLPLNAQATDSFTYEVNGVAATATVTITGIDNNDTVNGTSGANTLSGGVGNDTVRGLGGDDVLIGGAGADALDGGADVDTASYVGSDAAVQVSLLAGTSAGGHAAGDVLSGIENLTGSSHNDTLSGDGGVNIIRGEAGNDFLVGWGGDDQLFGGAGTDVLFHGDGADLLDGGGDIDYVTYASAANVVLVNLTNQALNAYSAQGDTYVDVEAFYLTGANDVFTGDANNNFVFGQGGNDTIIGGGGGDIIFGEGGNDHITSGALGDILSGGAGADTFAYTINQIEQDQILDFTVGEDKLAFDQGSFNLVHQQPFAGINFFSTTSGVGASYAAGQSALIYYSDLGLLYADTDGAGGADANLIAALSGNPALSASDFVFA